MSGILLGFAGAVPVLVLAGAVFAQRWRRERSGVRPGTEERLLRPAGYSLGKRIEAINEQYSDMLLVSFLCALTAVGVLTTGPRGSRDEWIVFVIFGLVSAICTVLAWRKLQRLRVCRLGLLGEQTVGELLSRLLAAGCFVYHDVPGSGDWNVDHVVVGPGGIFAIETKCFSKKRMRDVPKHIAGFDGAGIQFPGGFNDLETPEQAKRNAKWLAKELSEAIGEKVEARAVVALPGWFVTDPKKEWDVWVLNGKMVPGWIEEEPERFSEVLVKRVAYQLDRLCRDVEF